MEVTWPLAANEIERAITEGTKVDFLHFLYIVNIKKRKGTCIILRSYFE